MAFKYGVVVDPEDPEPHDLDDLQPRRPRVELENGFSSSQRFKIFLFGLVMIILCAEQGMVVDWLMTRPLIEATKQPTGVPVAQASSTPQHATPAPASKLSTRANCGRMCKTCEEFCVPWNSHFFSMIEDCGSVCKIEPDGLTVTHSQGKYFEEIRKTIDCVKLWTSPHIDVPLSSKHPPRLKDLPKQLVDLYSYGGKIDMKEYYFDQNYYGKQKDISGSIHNWTSDLIEGMISQLRTGKLQGTYGATETNCFAQSLGNTSFRDKKVLVIGSEIPWVEAVMLHKGAAHVMTLEYANLVSSHARVSTVTPAALAELVRKGQAPSFDAIVSFSSLEHSGLGRYGDGVNPYGDLITSAKAWCLANPGADFVVGVPSSGTYGFPTATIRYNADRDYGPVMYAQLFANWRQKRFHSCLHSVYSAEKLPPLRAVP
jgi:hypothetical protein